MRILLWIFIVVAALGIARFGMQWITRYYSGPVSDHFDGRRFFLPGMVDDRGAWAVWRWQFTRKPAAWPKRVETHQSVPPARQQGGDLRVTFIGHATALVQTEGLNILTDPVYSERASPVQWLGPKRVRAPGIAFEHLPKIDIITVSHNHYDHLDLPTLKRLWARDRPRILTPLGNDAIIRTAIPEAEIITLDWHESAELAPGLRLHCLPAKHWSSRWGWDHNRALWGSFALTTPHGNLFLTGDMGYDGAMLRTFGTAFGGFRFALLPIGAYAPRWFMALSHMNPDEAVHSLQDLRAASAMAVHHGTFQLTDEAIDAPEQALQAALRAQGIAPERFRAPDVGEGWQIP